MPLMFHERTRIVEEGLMGGGKGVEDLVAGGCAGGLWRRRLRGGGDREGLRWGEDIIREMMGGYVRYEEIFSCHDIQMM